MTDSYLELTQTGWGSALVSMLGLPKPPRLRRAGGAWSAKPLEGYATLVGAGEKSLFIQPLVQALHEAGAALQVRPELPGFLGVKTAAAEMQVPLAGLPSEGAAVERLHALVYDASGLSRPDHLHAVYDFFQPQVAKVAANGRVLIVAQSPETVTEGAVAATQAALRGFMKSLGKELGRKGITVNLLEVGPGVEALAGPVRFFLSEHSAFVSGQPLVLNAAGKGPANWVAPLKGKVALVTGAARGIGASIAEVLAREGAQVVGVDRPQEEKHLGETLAKISGMPLALDITAADAPARIAAEAQSRFGGLDIVIHNAGITRDKTLRNMSPQWWDQVLEVNLASIVRINDALLPSGLKDGARMVCVSSIGGIAGNPGQTNYGATKSGVIGYVASMAAALARRGGAINAVAPGFIETQMTAMMPMGPRVMGRLMSSLSQGGLPVDIAETVAFLSSPYAAAVNGRTLRVCGQHLVGA